MKVFKTATKIFGLIFPLLFVSSVYSQNIYTLPIGTEIYARMDNEINSKVFNINDTFTATVSKPLIVQEAEMLPIGTIIEGRIIKIKSAGFGKKSGSFEVRFEKLKLPDGAERRIDAELVSLAESKSSTTSNAVLVGGGTIIGALFGALVDKSKGALIGAGTGFGIGTIAVLLQKGKEARIKSNQEIRIRLRRAVTLPVEDF